MSDDQDPQVAAMLADPAAYFAKVRREAREEAEVYVARRRRMGITKRTPRRIKGSFYLRVPFSGGREFVIRGTPPLTPAEYDYLLAALADLRPAFVASAAGPGGADPKETDQ